MSTPSSQSLQVPGDAKLRPDGSAVEQEADNSKEQAPAQSAQLPLPDASKQKAQPSQQDNPTSRSGASAASSRMEQQTTKIVKDLQKEYDMTHKSENEAANARVDALFKQKQQLSPQVFGASEIDLFAMETRARQTLHELVFPIYGQIDGERKVRAEMEVMYDKVLQRLIKLEELLGASNKKPKMIEDVEAMVADARKQEALDVAGLQSKLNKCVNQQHEINENMEELNITISGMRTALDLREKQIQAVVADNLKQKQDLLDASTQIYAKIEESNIDLKKSIKIFQGTINLNSQTIADFGLRVADAESSLADMEKMLGANTKSILQLAEEKQSQEHFEDYLKMAEQEFKSIKYANKDNFEQLMATDNYIEKYLPFKVQEMISDCFAPVFARLDRLLPETEPADAMRKGGPRDFKGVYKMHEHKVYKRLHKLVINDKGIPNLKKRGFTIPGQRKVLDSGDRLQLNQNFEIQNTMAKESDLVFQDSEQLPGDQSELQKQASIGAPKGSSLAVISKASAGSPDKHLDTGADSKRSHNPKRSSRVAAPRRFHSLEELSDPGQDDILASEDHRNEGMKEIGMEDLDKKLQGIIEKSYHNSLLTMENFEKMKLDFKMMRTEIVDELRSNEVQFRQEVRESLSQQLSFIEEQNQEQKREYEAFLTRINHQDMKLESQASILKEQSNLLQRLLENSNRQESKTVVSSREATFDFEGILKQTQHRQQDAATGRSGETPSRGDATSAIKQPLTPSHSQENVGNKGIKEWMMECFKLQNILNNQFQTRVAETEAILHRLMKQLQHQKGAAAPSGSTHSPASPAHGGQQPGSKPEEAEVKVIELAANQRAPQDQESKIENQTNITSPQAVQNTGGTQQTITKAVYEKGQSESKATDYIMNITKTPDEPHSELRSLESSIPKDQEQANEGAAISQQPGKQQNIGNQNFFLNQNPQVAGILKQNYDDMMSNTPLNMLNGSFIKIQNDSQAQITAEPNASIDCNQVICLIDRIMEQCELVKIASNQEEQRRASLFSAKGRNVRNISTGTSQKLRQYQHLPIFQHGSVTLKTPGLSHTSKNITFSSQASERAAVAQTLDNTINSAAVGPTPVPRLEAGANRGGAFRTIVSGSQHRRVQSSDYHSLQIKAAQHGRNTSNATAIIARPPIGLNDSFITPASLNLGNTSTKKGHAMINNKFDQLQVGNFDIRDGQPKGVKYAHMAQRVAQQQ